MSARFIEHSEYKPKAYPSQVLAKDWSKRKVYCRNTMRGLLDEIHDMEVKDDDVWIVTLPKCGTTWMQELLWLVMNDYDFDTARREHLEVRTPFLEFDFLLNEDLSRCLEPVKALKSPRLIKSHLSLPLLPAELWQKKPKTVYVSRNPKDAVVSEFYHCRSLGFHMDITLDQFVLQFLSKNSFDHFQHMSEFHALRHEPWIYYTSFERMKLNLRQTITDVVAFLNKSITPQQMEAMLKHLSFEEMKKNPKLNHSWEFDQVRAKLKTNCEKHNFVRKGKVNGYREELSPKVVEKLDQWSQQQESENSISLRDLLLLDAEAVAAAGVGNGDESK